MVLFTNTVVLFTNTVVLFTRVLLGASVFAEQFWGRAVRRASDDSISNEPWGALVLPDRV